VPSSPAAPPGIDHLYPSNLAFEGWLHRIGRDATVSWRFVMRPVSSGARVFHAGPAGRTLVFERVAPFKRPYQKVGVGSASRFVRLAGQELVAVFRDRVTFAPGATISLAPDGVASHLFDKASGQRI